jgi:PIN domain nuclease of toxin-antitoxin system
LTRLLLDTHLLVWWMNGEASRISERGLAALGSEGTEPVVSAVAIWETAIKRRVGKLRVPDDMLRQIEGSGVELLPITVRHAELVASLPAHHADPFDRLLVSQAMLENLPLVSDDEQLSRYEVEVVW